MTTDARNLDLLVVADHASERTSAPTLQALGLAHRRPQSGGDVGRDVVAAGRDHARMRDATIDVEKQIRSSTPDVNDADADLLFVVAEHGLGACERFEHDI